LTCAGRLTPELADLLNARIGVLPKQIQRALRLLSLCEPMDIDVLASLAGYDTIEQCETRGIGANSSSAISLSAVSRFSRGPPTRIAGGR
jgi:hypothetical protein